MSRVPWPRFLVLNFIGAAAWAVLIAGLGWGGGHALGRLMQGVDADELWGLAALALALVAWRMARRGVRRAIGPRSREP